MTSPLLDAGTVALALALSGRVTVLLCATWLGAALARHRSAAARHRLWALGVTGALLLPVVSAVLPAVPVPLAPVDGGASLVATAALLSAALPERGVPAWPAAVAVAWAVGTGVVALRTLRGHAAAHRLWRGADPAVPARWLEARSEAAATLGSSAAVALRRSDAVGSPMTVGVVWPRVLLPAAADGWSPDQLRAALVHELGHVQRRDTLVQFGAQVVCALYWWNPLAWLAAARLRAEREHACDDLVLAAGARPSAYAEDLLHLARRLSKGTAAAGCVACMAHPSGTQDRLRRILDPAVPRGPLGTPFRAGAPLAAAAATLILACTSAPAAPLPAVGRPATLWVGAPWFSSGLDAEGEPSADVAVDLAQVEQEVLRHADGLRRCYEDRLAASPGLAGRVVAHWVIAPDGSVGEQCITNDDVGDPELLACVNALIAEARFPASSGAAVDVTFPFVFSAPTAP